MSKFSYLSRELSLLYFNERVLSLALDKKNPLLERLKFACIVSANLDEFYEIRYAGLLEIYKSKKRYSRDGYQVELLLDTLGKKAHEINDKLQRILYSRIIPNLGKYSIHLITDKKWGQHLNRWTEYFFIKEIQGLVTPILVDNSRPFPNIINKAISFVAEISCIDSKEKTKLAIIQIPLFIPLVIQVPYRIARKTKSFIFLGALMRAYIHRLFPGQVVINSYQFKLTRNSDLFISEDEADIRNALKGSLTTRNFGAGVRLEVSTRMPAYIKKFLAHKHSIRDDCIFPVQGPSNLSHFIDLGDKLKSPELMFLKHNPKDTSTESLSIFDWIKTNDRLLHHPYDSFNPIITLLNEAASDKNVLTIKQTIYRTGKQSSIMNALMYAAQNGKEVTVVIELMARFDEETNMNWSSRLESVGVHVIHSHLKRKCHAKMLLITRRELNIKTNKFHIIHYGHLGTGNYSQKNSLSYTDFSFLTINKVICNDMDKIFSELTGSSLNIRLKKLWHTPEAHRLNLKKLIKNEIRVVKKGGHGHIIIKTNSLVDHEMIDLLYQASLAGVKIDLIVRGMCALKIGEKYSKNIKVYSVIGRFLEHNRIFFFNNNNNHTLWLSSSDWMERNLSNRLEVTFPIEDNILLKKVYDEGLHALITDSSKWSLTSEGDYRKNKPKDNDISGQLKNITLRLA